MSSPATGSRWTLTPRASTPSRGPASKSYTAPMPRKLLRVAWRSNVSQPEAGSLEERPDESRLLTHATEGQMQLHVHLLQVQAGQVPQFDLLDLPPQPFHGVQVRGVRRQGLHVDRVTGLRHERLHLGPAMNRRPVPDDQETISTLATQVDEELDRMQPAQRRRPHQRVDLALHGHPAHDREVVARLPLVHDRCPSPRSVGLDRPREEVEARLVHENKGPVLAAGPLLQRRPRLGPPSSDRLLVPLDRASDGDLRGPSQALEQARHLTRAVRDAELLADDPGDPLTGPDVPPEAVGLGPMPEEVGDQAKLLGGELGGRARGGVRAERVRTAAAGGGQPPADGPLGGVERERDLALLPALSRQIQRPHPPPLPPVMRLSA